MAVEGVEVDEAMAVDFRRSTRSIVDDVAAWERVCLCQVGLSDAVDITKLGFLEVEVETKEALGLSNLLAADVEIVKFTGFFGPDDVLGLTVAEFTVYLVRTRLEAGSMVNFEGEGPEEVLGRPPDRVDVDGVNGLSLDGINVESETILGLGLQESCEDSTGQGRELPFMGSW